MIKKTYRPNEVAMYTQRFIVVTAALLIMVAFFANSNGSAHFPQLKMMMQTWMTNR